MPKHRFFAGGPELWSKCLCFGLACLLLSGCAREWATRPAAVAPPTAPAPPIPARPTATSTAGAVLVQQPLTETQGLSLPAPLDRYRAWMAEARARYPYPEPVDTMWAVMLCESEGEAEAVALPYYGLFQYLPETWAGDWNPYRDRPIFDPQAQIYATAKAWSEGYQVWWWGCLPSSEE